MQLGHLCNVAVQLLGLAYVAAAGGLLPGLVAGPLSQTFQDFDDVRDLAEHLDKGNVTQNIAVR